MFEGWNIGAVSVKRVRLHDDGRIEADTRRHEGEPERAFLELAGHGSPIESGYAGARSEDGTRPAGAVVTGPQAASLLSLPYLPESLCVEAALRYLDRLPDLVLSLGGESFVVYCMAEGMVRGMVSSNRCAAGSGEFLVQQFGRMDFDLHAGLEAADRGRRVPLASRCSVHCKSDATHKLNKGECVPADIAHSLIAELGGKIATLVSSTNWPRDSVLLAGNLVQSHLLVEEVRRLLSVSRVDVDEHSVYLEALGAAVSAREAGARDLGDPREWLRPREGHSYSTRVPLTAYAGQVDRMSGAAWAPLVPGMDVILGVDAGSTTTKAVLLDRESHRPVVGCYLRTHGNPVRAASECLEELSRQVGGTPVRIVQAATTGSGRDIVAVSLDNCLMFNEILAHARAAREAAPDVDTLFELGGQDAKFVALQAGIPVDYAMNDGCSAGTGSFLEESAGSDMHVPMEEIGLLALKGTAPVAFGERCAAFINSEIRVALQQGVDRTDVLAGLVYAIVDNYLARVVGARHIGRTILLQGGVALNPALALAVAGLTGAQVRVPPLPEMMGAIGAAQMADDLLTAGDVDRLDRDLTAFGAVQMEEKESFTCKSCENRCEIQRIALDGHTYPFGGLCSKWEMQRRPEALRHKEGVDLVGLRQELMFQTFAPEQPSPSRGRIGLPLALNTYEVYPFFARLLTGLGYEVVLSRPGMGERRTHAPLCYPGELLHAAVDDLLAQEVDYVFLPYLREFPVPDGLDHGYLCPVTEDTPGVIKTFFATASDRILTPEIGLTDHLRSTTEREVARMAARLGVDRSAAHAALAAARAHQEAFEHRYREAIEEALEKLDGPAVVLVGRPYAAYAPEVNLSVPRKIASRGFTVIPGDALPFTPPANRRNVWHHTQRVLAAVDYVRDRDDLYVCALSCFSCGPDAIIHHRLRLELEGRPFCFLEIDSHTAHAGIETRVGAFLDIIEERRQRHAAAASMRPHATRAHVEGKGRKVRIVLGDGSRLGFDDPRVLHVLLGDFPPVCAGIMKHLYGTLGWEAIATADTDAGILQAARSVCSGRECLPFLSMMGKAARHLESRPAGEVTVFHLLEQEGPCQIGSWFDAAAIAFERLGFDDAVVAWPSIHNAYLGAGEKGAASIAAAAIVGDLLEEVRSSLRCLAVDRSAALTRLDELEAGLLTAAQGGLVSTDRELRRVATSLAEIPLRERPAEAPKVLLFGGINRIFVDVQVREFFEERGILCKTNDLSEFVSLMEFEEVSRSGFERGYLTPAAQNSWGAVLGSLTRGGGRSRGVRVVQGRVHGSVVSGMERRWRGIMERSGLLFAPSAPFNEVASKGHQLISVNGYSEAPFTVGRLIAGLEAGDFDGYVNIGAFNCAPANLATAALHDAAVRSGVPYAVVEADGSSITAGQLRQLETVAAHCLRGRMLRTEHTLENRQERAAAPG